MVFVIAEVVRSKACGLVPLFRYFKGAAHITTLPCFIAVFQVMDVTISTLPIQERLELQLLES